MPSSTEPGGSLDDAMVDRARRRDGPVPFGPEMERELPAGTVTLLFTDIEGSTALLHRLGRDYGDVLAAHHRVLRDVWRTHNGVEVDTEGDAFFVAFTRADRAVAATAAAQAAIRTIEIPAGGQLRVRMGLHTGTPELRDGSYWGEDVHYAARVVSAAHGGQVLLSAATAALLGDPQIELQSLGEHALKDFPIPRELLHLVYDGVEASAFPVPKTATRLRTNLHASVEDLIGREADRAEVQALFDSGAPLVTLTGPGGTGKTQLALRVAQSRLDRHADGVFFVPLAGIRQPGGLLPAILQTLSLVNAPDVEAAQVLADYLRGRQVLLVLDNFEQLLAAGGQLSLLIDAASGLQLLVTSQAPLRIARESVFRLGPLGGVEAETLLIRRAQMRDASYDPEPERNAIVSLCAELDGLPLALELAGARLPLLGAEILLDRLREGHGVLRTRSPDSPERQRSLAATLDWTIELLSSSARGLLDLVAAFPGGVGLDLLSAAADLDLDDALDDLEELLAFSLIGREGSRYRCAQALRRHVQGADGTRTLRADRAACRALSELAGGATERMWDEYAQGLATLGKERENILAGLRWAAGHDAELHARLLSGTHWWALAVGLQTEFSAHFAQAGSVTGHEPWQLDLRGALAFWRLQETGRLGAFSTEIVGIAGECARLGRFDQAVSVYCNYLQWLASERDTSLAHAVLDRAGDAAARAGVAWAPKLVAMNRAQLAVIDGDTELLEALSRRLLDEAQPGSYFEQASHLWADAAMLRADVGETVARYGRALAIAWSWSELVQCCFEMDGIAMGLVLNGRYEAALEVMASVGPIREELALLELPGWWEARIRDCEAIALAELDEPTVAAARARGRARSTEEAVTHAMKLSAPARLES